MAADAPGAKPFEIQVQPDRIFLRVAPAGSSGQKVSLTEIQRELDKLKVKYRPEVLFNIYRRARNEFEPLATREVLDFEATVEVSQDAQQAHIIVVGPPTGNDPLPPAKVKAAIEEAKVEKGILFDELRRVIGQRLLSKPVLIAQGLQAKHGTDGRVIFVEPEQPKPMVGPDDVVDWRERNLVRNVNQGEEIALVIPPTPGVDGYTVTGKVLKARQGRRAPVRLGHNVAMNAAGTAIVAAKSGYVVNTAGKISVEDVFQAVHINQTTGNVRFSGVVSVTGNIEDTFTVEAGKGVRVGGSVGQAVIKTDGDVEIRGGANRATIEAGGSISARFFSECRLLARGDILAEEYILHGTAESERAVRVAKAPDGFINGAIVRAQTEISAAVLGSAKSEEETRLEVGAGVSTRAQFEHLQPLMAKRWEQFERNRKNLGFLQESREGEGVFPDDKRNVMRTLAEATVLLRDELWQDLKTYRELLSALGDPNAPARAVILASNLVNAGVHVSVQRLTMQMKSPLQECAFMIVDGQLRPQDYAMVEKMLKQLKKKA